MPEIDMRGNPWAGGIPYDSQGLARDTYFLLALFTASKEISLKRPEQNEDGSVYGYCLHNFELPEISRLLVSLAAMCRNAWEHSSFSIEDSLELKAESPVVGTLIKNIEKDPVVEKLHVRESWNKILHCRTINFERSEAGSIYSGHLEPVFHLYGEFQSKKWKASIDVFRWCEVIHALT